MQYFHDDEPLIGDPEPTEDWDDLFDLIDHGYSFNPYDTQGDNPPSYAVLRLVFSREDPFAPHQDQIDLLTWQQGPVAGHEGSHPESDAVRWLYDQKQRDPSFGRGIRQVRMLIQDQPCTKCLHHLKASLGKVLPTGSQVQVKWVKPAPKRRFAFFRDRRYTPRVNRWR
ncbi:hypothetical protein MUK70_01620 [Dyadobacter chenwenxiniae]|uniref:Uncharacterized protein n=1 Tax=Dyadobacter chenwenxiniae TaxID=2906456 RepID=A0A9X1PLE7_9BACT|nr:hypothetical protein [Dyadobacter chenwenxiniae]MCF0062555.1 hypothetical protein [Dyadobacter chenwenxiniae]UON83701.1 hypothetical protein MUK70_01620 [Dyadobacter chenwenxiniae]